MRCLQRVCNRKGFVVGKDKVHVSILQFANDTLIFCKYDDNMLNALIEITQLFEWCSGQKVNKEKSALCGLNIDQISCCPSPILYITRLNRFHFFILVFLRVAIPRKLPSGSLLLIKSKQSLIVGSILIYLTVED